MENFARVVVFWLFWIRIETKLWKKDISHIETTRFIQLIFNMKIYTSQKIESDIWTGAIIREIITGDISVTRTKAPINNKVSARTNLKKAADEKTLTMELEKYSGQQFRHINWIVCVDLFDS